MDDEAPRALPPPRESRLHGFVTSFRELFVTLVEMSFTRLELIFVELQEWVESLVRIILWGLVGILAAGATLLLGALTLIFAFWDTHRLLVSLLVLAGFALITAAAAFTVLRKVRNQRAPFASTLAEFAKDRELLLKTRRTQSAQTPPFDPPPTHAPPDVPLS